MARYRPGERRTPTHIIRSGADPLALCGIEADTTAVSVVVARFVGMHVRGWGMEVCPACRAELRPPPPIRAAAAR